MVGGKSAAAIMSRIRDLMDAKWKPAPVFPLAVKDSDTAKHCSLRVQFGTVGTRKELQFEKLVKPIVCHTILTADIIPFKERHTVCNYSCSHTCI